MYQLHQWKIARFFVDLKLVEEKQWYDNQVLDIPFVQFFNNSHIIGMANFFWLSNLITFIKLKIVFRFYTNIYLYIFSILDLFHDKTKGLFTLLNDECTLQKPSIGNFESNLKNAWEKNMIAPISWDIRGQKTTGNIFLIRHFTNDVIYSTVYDSWILMKYNEIILN